jgi:beta-lactamase class A
MSSTFVQALDRVRAELPGSFAVCAERLDRPPPRPRLAWNEDATFPAASVIKLALALEVRRALDEGALDEGERLELRAEAKVAGSGVLAALTPGLRLPIVDLLYLSMAISDNTATNLLIERVGAAAVNARLDALGLATTRLAGRIFVDGESGERSPTTAAELVRLLGWVDAHAPGLVALLEQAQTASTVGRGLPDTRFAGVGAPMGTAPAITLATKTGSLHGVVAEAAIVTTPRARYAIALLSEGSGDLRPNHDNVGRVKLAELSRAVYATFEGDP